MSRYGFAIADTDTGMMADPKILALARLLHDPVKTGAAICLYDAVRLASWRAGERLTLAETVPGWWLDAADELAAALSNVHLLDDERRIPVHAWESWYVPARDRRLDAGRKSIYGGLVSHGMAPDDANREADRRIAAERTRLDLEARPNSSDLIARPPYRTVPSVPFRTVPSGTSDGKLWKDFGPEWDAVREAWTNRGFSLPPSGTKEDSQSQRAILYEILDSRPTSPCTVAT
jgi:hypothetical protein